MLIRYRTAPVTTSFSILGRIGGDATLSECGQQSADHHFQYPRSDRRRCNQFAGRVPDPQAVRFQYPRSDRRRCNYADPARLINYEILSVSSVGSEAMQPGGGYSKRQGEGLFQYPRSDRRRCNPPGVGVGSGEQNGFQYPRSDRRRCNVVTSRFTQEERRDFQYPRSDRRRCNNGISILTTSVILTFSILGRIGGDATLLSRFPVFPWTRLSVSSVGSEAMQPPKWQARLATDGHLSVSSVGSEAMQLWLIARWEYDASQGLSVSSVGSEAMQRCESLPIGCRSSLSVSSVGSEAMQHDGKDGLEFGRYAFQYPRSDRRRCNGWANPGALLAFAFQYPRSDRRRCNAGAADGPGPAPALSVSSVGSEAMQQWKPYMG